jgi:hypothetical protein
MKEPLKFAIVMIYLVGNALTYNHLVKQDPSSAYESGTMLRNLAWGCAWPVYWAIRFTEKTPSSQE